MAISRLSGRIRPTLLQVKLKSTILLHGATPRQPSTPLQKHGFDGIGICLQGYEQIAFDIDHCRDPTTGEIDPWALALVKRADSYCEITPSKTGLRIIGHGSGKRILRKQSVPQANGVTLESYRACEKYITVTGDHLEGTPETLNDFSALMDSTVAELDAAKGKRTDGPGSADDGGHHARQQQRRG